MTLIIRQIHSVFVGEVTGVDCSRKLSAVADIEAGMDQYAVLVFRNQPLTEACAAERNRKAA